MMKSAHSITLRTKLIPLAARTTLNNYYSPKTPFSTKKISHLSRAAQCSCESKKITDRPCIVHG